MAGGERGPCSTHSCSALQRLSLAPLLPPCWVQKHEARSAARRPAIPRHRSQMDTSHGDLHAQLCPICNPSAWDPALLPLSPGLKAAVAKSRRAQPERHPSCCQQGSGAGEAIGALLHLQLHRSPTQHPRAIGVERPHPQRPEAQPCPTRWAARSVALLWISHDRKTRSPFPTGGQVYLRQFKINPGLAFVSSALPCVIMLSAWLSSKVCFPQEPVSKRSQRRMLTEGAEKQRQPFSSSPPRPACSTDHFAFPSPSAARRLAATRGLSFPLPEPAMSAAQMFPACWDASLCPLLRTAHSHTETEWWRGCSISPDGAQG